MATRTIQVAIVGDASSLQAAFGKAGSAATGFGARLKTIGSSLTDVGSTLTHKVTLPVAVAFGAGAKMAVDFQSKMELIHTSAGATQQEVDKLSGSVLKLAQAKQQGPDELADALYHLESVGLRGAKAMDVLGVAADGAAVGGAKLDDVTNALAHAVVAGIKGTGDMRAAMGQLNAIVGAGDMKMQDLVNALSSGILPAGRAAGLSLQDVGAALATMTDAGVPAEEAATRLRMTFSLMGAPTGKAQKALAQIGIGQLDLAHKMSGPQGLIGALTLLKTHLDAFSKDPAKQKQILTEAFGGAKSSTTIITLLQQMDRLKGKFEEIGATGKKFNQDVLAQQQTSLAKLKTAWSSVQVALIKLGGVAMPIIADFANALAGVADEFTKLSPKGQKIVAIVLALAAALGPALSLLGNMAKGIALLTSPTGLVIAALAALGVALYEAWTHSATFRSVVRQAWADVQSAAQAAVSFYRSNVQPTITAVLHTLSALWQRYGADVINYVRTGLNTLLAVLRPTMQVILGVVKAVLALLRGDWSGVWNALKQIVSNVLNGIVALIRGEVAVMAAAAKLVAKVAVDALKAGLSLLAGIARAAMSALIGAIRGAAGAVAAAARAVGNAIVNAIKSGAAGVAHIATYLWGLLVGGLKSLASVAAGEALAIGEAIVNGIINGVEHLAGSLINKVKSVALAPLNAVKSLLGIGSPSRRFAAEVGRPIVQGITQGIQAESAHMKLTLTSTVVDAIRQAKSNLTSLASDISGMIGQGLDAQATQLEKNVDNSPDAKRLKALQDQLQAEQDNRQQTQLQQAIDQATTPEERKAAELDLTEFLQQQEATRLQNSLDAQKQQIQDESDARKAAADKNLADLTDALNRGLITEQQFNQRLQDALAASGINYQNLGSLLGSAFANGFSDSLQALQQQVIALASGPQGPGISGAEPNLSDPFAVQFKEWDDHRKQLVKNLAAARKAADVTSKKHPHATDAEQAAVNKANAALQAWVAKRPKRLAQGGVITSPTFAEIGEAGPEAVIPLTKPGAARDILAAIGGRGPTIGKLADTIVVQSGHDIALIAAKVGSRLALAG